MTDTPAATLFIQRTTVDARRAPVGEKVALWRSLFGDAISAVVSVGALATLVLVGPQLLSWAVINGVWTGGPEACRDAGACWAFLVAKGPFILFGIYPPDQQWRPALVVLIYVALALWTLDPRRWTRATFALWAGGTAVVLALMGGGVAGLAPVPTSAWGGLPITLLLTEISLAVGFPLGLTLALARRSGMPMLRWTSTAFIEVIRGLPLLTLLFVASIVLPIMLPDGMDVDKLARALAALTIFSAAYLAEVLRGGLQGVPAGQAEAARALGLGWWQTTRLIVVPQAIGKVIPALTNTVVVIVKNTSLVLVVGLFDLLSAGRAALSDPEWPAAYMETYAFIALIYFAICFSISRYALWLERRAAVGAST